MEPKIIFEDNHLLVVEKPAGMLTQPAGENLSSLETWCKQWLKEKYQKPGNVFLEAIHRLDKPVGGIVVFAKTSKALSRLQESMRNKETKKIYRALVEGLITESTGTLENFLIHDDFMAKVVSKSAPQAKLARLHYKVVEHRNNQTVVEIELETGRYHQIRAQFAEFNHPVVGDKKYGAKTSFTNDAIALHHIRLSIPHPITKIILTFESLPNF